MVKLVDHSDIFDPHQREAYDKIVGENGGIVWMNVGDGKTRVALMAAMEIACSGDYPVIVIIARRAAFYDWQQEIATLQLDVEVIESENLANQAFTDRKTIVLVSDGKLAQDITQDLMWRLKPATGCYVVDELWLFKNPKAQKSIALHQFTKNTPTIGISGTVMTARDVVDIYGQVSAVGRANTLAPTLTKFRGQYQMGIQGKFFSWYPKKGAYQEIMEKIEPFTYLYMPDLKRVETKTSIIKVQPTQQQLDYIKELKETAAIEGKFELTNMANIITKAQQISNGWIKREDGFFEAIFSTKIVRLLALLDELMQTPYKMVVWCAFRNDITRITEAINEAFGHRIATLQSGEPFDVELWKRKDCRICLATEASGSSINHFAQVPYAIYFSQDFKWQSLQQSQGRHTRRSSKHTTAYNIFLHTEKSLDSKIYYTVRSSQRGEKSFIQKMDAIQWIKEK